MLHEIKKVWKTQWPTQVQGMEILAKSPQGTRATDSHRTQSLPVTLGKQISVLLLVIFQTFEKMTIGIGILAHAGLLHRVAA